MRRRFEHQQRRRSLTERLVVGLIRWTSPREWRDSVAGDLQEEFHRTRSRLGLEVRALLLAGRLLAHRLRLSARFGSNVRPNQGGGRRLMKWHHDLRFAARSLRRSRGFSLLVIGVLALGIGANTAIFSIIHAVLIRPLPYPQPDQLVLLYDRIPGFSNYVVQSEGSYLAWKESNDVFSSLACFRPVDSVLVGEGPPARLPGLRATAELFEMLRVAPLTGRTLSSDDDLPESPDVVLLTEGLWRSRFGADPGLVGRSLRLDGEAVTVVGILPAGFLFPPPVNLRGRVRQYHPSFYRPLKPRAENFQQRGSFVLGRLHEGITLQQAQDRLQATARQIAARQLPQADQSQFGAVVLPLHEQAVSDSRPLLLMLLGAVALILMIACVNVANLYIARGTGRRNELAVRSALGAGPEAVTRQLLFESILLALAGGVVGLLLAQVSLQGLLQLGAGRIPGMGPVTLNPAVLLFTFLISAASGLAFGLYPALSLSRPELQSMLGSAGRGSRRGDLRRRLRGALLVVEIALAASLLVGAGLLLRSLNQLQQVTLGFRVEQIHMVPVVLPSTRYAEDAQQRRFASEVLEQVQSVPGISQAALSYTLPLSSRRARASYQIEGRENADEQVVDFRIVSPGYFQMLEIPLLEGRGLQDEDDEEAPPAALVNRTFRDRHFPAGSSAVGARFSLGTAAPGPDTTYFTIIGVVEDTKEIGLTQAAPVTMYGSISQLPLDRFVILFRSAADDGSLLAALQHRLAKLDPELPVQLGNLQSVVHAASSGTRSPTVLMAILAGLAVMLALLGLYGVLSYLVAQRTQEIGIRMAVGANGRDILRLIGGEAAVLVATGLALGAAASLGLARLLSGLLYGVTASDPLTYLAVALVFSAVAALAALIPARRASRVDPLTALRTE